MIPESNGEAKHVFEEVDIFKTEGSGVLWLGSCSSLEAAQVRINELLISDPGEYFTYNQPTGHKVISNQTGTTARGNTDFAGVRNAA